MNDCGSKIRISAATGYLSLLQVGKMHQCVLGIITKDTDTSVERTSCTEGTATSHLILNSCQVVDVDVEQY